MKIVSSAFNDRLLEGSNQKTNTGLSLLYKVFPCQDGTLVRRPPEGYLWPGPHFENLFESLAAASVASLLSILQLLLVSLPCPLQLTTPTTIAILLLLLLLLLLLPVLPICF